MRRSVEFRAFFVILVLMTGLLFAGGQTDTDESSMPLVGMVTDVGGLGDRSFNDGCYAGMKQAEDEGMAKVIVVESKQMTDYIPNLSGLGEDGASLVFAVGFLMYDAVLEYSQIETDKSQRMFFWFRQCSFSVQFEESLFVI